MLRSASADPVGAETAHPSTALGTELHLNFRPLFPIRRQSVCKDPAKAADRPAGRRARLGGTQHDATWSSTIPVACISAYAVVGPTNLKPRRLSSLAIAVDSGVTAGTSDRSAGRGRGWRRERPQQLARGRRRGRRPRARWRWSPRSWRGCARSPRRPSAARRRARRSGRPSSASKRSKARRKFSRLRRMISHDSPLWNASSVIRSNSRLTAAQRLAPLGVVVVAVEHRIGCGPARDPVNDRPAAPDLDRRRRRRRSRLLGPVAGQRVSALEPVRVARLRRSSTPYAARTREPAGRAAGRVPGPAGRAPSRPRWPCSRAASG